MKDRLKVFLIKKDLTIDEFMIEFNQVISGEKNWRASNLYLDYIKEVVRIE